MSSDETAIRSLLDEWTKTTREGRQGDVLKSHLPELTIFDVLPPLKYDSAAAYRASWDEWHPDAQGEMRFEFEDISVTAGNDVAFAFGLLQCGGTLPDGKTFRDIVRATFCLRKVAGGWKVAHQHVSKPFDRGQGKVRLAHRAGSDA